MPQTMPPPIPMVPLTALVRSAFEECTNELATRGEAVQSVTELVALPDGTQATLRCARTRTGLVTVTIRQPKPSAASRASK
jgi:hypothetical protein